MAIAFVSSSSAQNDGASSITISHTVASGSNRLLVVKSHVECNGTPANRPVTGITYNGDALTFANEISLTTSGSEDDTVEIWYMVAPDEGTFNVVTTWTGTVEGCVVGVENYTGVKQTSPVDATADAANAATPGPANVNIVTTVADCMLISAAHDISSGGTLTVNSGQTQTYNVQNAGQLKAAGAYELVTTATTYNESWTTTSGNRDWLVNVVAFKPAVASSTTYSGYYGYGQNY